MVLLVILHRDSCIASAGNVAQFTEPVGEHCLMTSKHGPLLPWEANLHYTFSSEERFIRREIKACRITFIQRFLSEIMDDSSSSETETNTSSDDSTCSEETETRRTLKSIDETKPKNLSRTSSPENKDTACLPEKQIGDGTGKEHTSPGRHGQHTQDGCKSRGAGVEPQPRPRPQVKYKTHSALIRQKLEQTKTEMRRTSEQHLRQRPERKAYHPFVWNSLSPYRDTTEIDYLLAMPSEH
ncbi:uncharacterized protein LOC143509504 [Brachyhypopomus gauderio]|uniref:uncharacterized protein LOC143509504 n=1 Tax=Brachyhypopomus gauderio TaxID=698409 RepID=UPI004041D2E5